MEAWERRFWEDDQLSFVRSEYKKLLQIGMTDVQVEEKLTSYCQEHLADDTIDIHRIPVALALAQWEMGRMSESSKENALAQLPFLKCTFDAALLRLIETRLYEVMPPKSAVPKIRMRRCPWREGSLLAYHIQTNEDCRNSPYWNSYVLLRAVKLVRWPHSAIAPGECFSETMLVGLYDWCGKTIPALEETKRLKFTPISIEPANLEKEYFDLSSLKALVTTNEAAAKSIVQRLTSEHVETCFSLNWDRKSKHDGTITYLGCDADFLDNDSFFSTNLTDYSMGGPGAFDGVLCRRLEMLHGK